MAQLKKQRFDQRMEAPCQPLCRIGDGRISSALATAAITFAASSLVRDDELSGIARVHDGDTIAINERRICLYGIDAPETDQACLDAEGERWNCGIAARDDLSSHVAGRIVTCEVLGKDWHRRTLAVCSTGGENLNAWLVQQGLALAYVEYSRNYIGEEVDAREQQRGIWGVRLLRHGIGDTAARIQSSWARFLFLSPRSLNFYPPCIRHRASPHCIIKGNINRNGERIYHLPGQLAYPKIDMRAPQKRWFCSEDEAQAAGWRPAKQ